LKVKRLEVVRSYFVHTLLIQQSTCVSYNRYAAINPHCSIPAVAHNNAFLSHCVTADE